MSRESSIERHGPGEVTITRIFDAPRRRLWAAWTEPEPFARWFSTPPFTTPVSGVAMDVRVGGEWRATQVSSADGARLPFAGVYKEVTEPERLVLTFENLEDRSDPDFEFLTLTFNDLGDKTELVLRQTGHLPDDEYAFLAEGYSRFFDQLDVYLSE